MTSLYYYGHPRVHILYSRALHIEYIRLCCTDVNWRFQPKLTNFDVVQLIYFQVTVDLKHKKCSEFNAESDKKNSKPKPKIFSSIPAKNRQVPKTVNFLFYTPNKLSLDPGKKSNPVPILTPFANLQTV